MAKVVTAGVVIDMDLSQSSANTIGVGSLEVDPFQTKQGYRIRAVEFRVEPAGVSGGSPDDGYIGFQFWAASSVPGGFFGSNDKKAIAMFSQAGVVLTSGGALYDCQWFWTPPYPTQLDIGSVYIGGMLATSGMTNPLNASIRLYGDVVTLTTDEQNASRAVYT